MGRKKSSSSSSAADNLKRYQQEWYEANKARVQAEKKKRYLADEEYREAAQRRSKQQYWFKTRPGMVRETNRTELAQLEPTASVTIQVKNAHDLRHKKAIRVPVFSTAAVAELIGRSAQTIGLWEKQGVLPPPVYRLRDVGDPGLKLKGRNPRLYTYDELEVLDEAVAYLGLPSPTLKESLFAATVREGFGALVQGIRPHLKDK